MPGKRGTCCHKGESYSEVLRVGGMVTVGGFFSGAFEELEASPREGGKSCYKESILFGVGHVFRIHRESGRGRIAQVWSSFTLRSSILFYFYFILMDTLSFLLMFGYSF